MPYTVAVQAWMSWSESQLKKKCASLGQLAQEKSPNMANQEQEYFERNLSLQFHILH